MAIKVGDKVVVIKGRDKRGRTGVVTEISGKCAGEDAEAFVHDLCNRNLIDVTASGSMSRNVAVEERGEE